MDLNKLNNYEFKENLKGQYDKIVEEINEFYVECVKNDRKRQIEEGLDVITSMLNYLKKVGMTDHDFKLHIEKLERYKNTKYELGGE